MTDPFAGSRPLRLDRLDVPRSWRVLALAPHPDDFESTAAAHRWRRDRGNPIGLLVLSSSANGVEDAFCDPPTPEAKAAAREDEQRAGCRMFGLAEDRLRLLRLRVAWPGGYLVDDEANFTALESAAAGFGFDLAVLPHGDDLVLLGEEEGGAWLRPPGARRPRSFSAIPRPWRCATTSSFRSTRRRPRGNARCSASTDPSSSAT